MQENANTSKKTLTFENKKAKYLAVPKQKLLGAKSVTNVPKKLKSEESIKNANIISNKSSYKKLGIKSSESK